MLCSIDPAFEVEPAEVTALVGEGSEQRRKLQLLGQLPGPGKAFKEAHEVLRAVEHIIGSEGFKYASAQANGNVATLKKRLCRIVGDRPPTLELAHGDEMLGDIAARFPDFLQHDKKYGLNAC